MLRVPPIEKGIVIDHITVGKGLKILQKLHLDQIHSPVVLLMNVPSKKFKKKDIIKIQDHLDIDLTILGLIDQNITINIIDQQKIVKKRKMKIPQKVKGLFQCKNPRCITAVEEYIQPEFMLVPNGKIQYRCSYCEELTEYKL